MLQRYEIVNGVSKVEGITSEATMDQRSDLRMQNQSQRLKFFSTSSTLPMSRG
ncbi:hypothetical protein U1Q18_045074 [Sarracenia purpurea var. burkii]